MSLSLAFEPWVLEGIIHAYALVGIHLEARHDQFLGKRILILPVSVTEGDRTGTYQSAREVRLYHKELVQRAKDVPKA